MSRSQFGIQAGWIPGISSRTLGPDECWAGFRARVECLEGRAPLATFTVDIVNFSFNPNTRVDSRRRHGPLGLAGERPHSTTSVAGSVEPWDSGVLNTGFTFDHTFTHAGTFTLLLQDPRVRQRGRDGERHVRDDQRHRRRGDPPVDRGDPGEPDRRPQGMTEPFTAIGTFSDNSTQNLTEPGDLGVVDALGGHDRRPRHGHGRGDRGRSTITATLERHHRLDP